MKRNLLILAHQIIDGIPEDRIDLSDIASNDRSGRADDPRHCGTIACAFGWLAMHPEFKKRGLGLEVFLDTETIYNKDRRHYFAKPTIHGEVKPYTDCASEVFGCTTNQAKFLFGPTRWTDDHPSDKAVFLNRVKKLVGKR